jgi:hypothetical protein
MTHQKPRRRLTGVGFVPAVVLFLAGCGLSDYEKRIDEHQKYLQTFDEETRLLGRPLNMPMKTVEDKNTKAKRQVPVFPVDFYLRPPREIDFKVKDKEAPFVSVDVSLYRYPLAAPAVPAAAKKAAGPARKNVLLAISRVGVERKKEDKDLKPKLGEPTLKEFQQRVRAALMSYYYREHFQPIDWSSFVKLQPEMVDPHTLKPAPKLKFESQRLQAGGKNGQLYYVYFHVNGNVQAAVIFEIPANIAADGRVNKAIDFSVRTLSLGPDVAKKRQEFARRPKVKGFN